MLAVSGGGFGELRMYSLCFGLMGPRVYGTLPHISISPGYPRSVGEAVGLGFRAGFMVETIPLEHGRGRYYTAGGLIMRIGFWGILSDLNIRRSSQHSIGNHLGPCIAVPCPTRCFSTLTRSLGCQVPRLGSGIHQVLSQLMRS